MLKVGDKVIRPDGSYAYEVTKCGLKPCHGIYYEGDIWTVVLTGANLPTKQSPYLGFKEVNDTIIINDDGVVVFTMSCLLMPYKA